MSTQNRINANLWQIANVNGNNQPTGIKVILSGSVDPTAASSLYPALYVNTTSSKMFYNTTGAANAWVLASGTATSATNLAGGAINQVPYQTAASTTAFISAGTSGQVLTANATGVPAWVTPTAPTSVANLTGGAAGNVPYQSAANTTMFTAAGTAGQILTSGGTGAPVWVTPTSSSGSQVFVAFGSTGGI